MPVNKAWIGRKINETAEDPDALAELYAAMKQPMPGSR